MTVPVPLTADPTRLPDPLSPTPRPLRGPLRPDPDDICDACVAGDCEHCQEDEHFCECLHGEGRPEHFYDPEVIPTKVPDSHTVIDGKLWRVIPSGFGYDDGSQSCRLVSLDERHDPEWPEHIASMEREAVDHLRAQRDHYRLSLREIADTSEDEATVRFAMRSLEGKTQITALVPIEDQPPAEAGHERCDLSTCRICDAVTLADEATPGPTTAGRGSVAPPKEPDND